jgi:hypothetical protein
VTGLGARADLIATRITLGLAAPLCGALPPVNWKLLNRRSGEANPTSMTWRRIYQSSASASGGSFVSAKTLAKAGERPFSESGLATTSRGRKIHFGGVRNAAPDKHSCRAAPAALFRHLIGRSMEAPGGVVGLATMTQAARGDWASYVFTLGAKARRGWPAHWGNRPESRRGVKAAARLGSLWVALQAGPRGGNSEIGAHGMPCDATVSRRRRRPDRSPR